MGVLGRFVLGRSEGVLFSVLVILVWVVLVGVLVILFWVVLFWSPFVSSSAGSIYQACIQPGHQEALIRR